MSIELSFRDQSDLVVLLVFVGVLLWILIGSLVHQVRERNRANETIEAILYLDPTIIELAPGEQYYERTLMRDSVRRLAEIKRRGVRVDREQSEVERALQRLAAVRKTKKKAEVSE